MRHDQRQRVEVPSFERQFFGAAERFTRIGSGPVGGKATGLLFMRDVVSALAPPSRIEIDIPTLTVIATDMYERFLSANALEAVVESGAPDDRLALAFQQASLPVELLGDLRALVQQVHSPLAVRSSSLLEDAIDEPFAGVYGTKMIPNNQPDVDTRFRRLAEAVKYVYASTFFAEAVAYRKAMGRGRGDDRMGVIIQEVVGRRHGDRYYPDVSGVARSFSFYRAASARPEDGVVTLALGLGRTIVDEGVGWTYSPTRPAAPPPVASVRELAEATQRAFWAVNMGPPPPYDPIRETEYLIRAPIEEAGGDGTLRMTASTYDPSRDRLVPGDGLEGARVLTFAPLLTLRTWPLNDAIRLLLGACEKAVAAPVEIEFAVTFDVATDKARIGFLQVRPMLRTAALVDISDADLTASDTVVASRAVLGNGTSGPIHDVVYVRPDRFEARHTTAIAAEVATINASLQRAHLPYLLIGFGRWGSADPWLGVQTTWAQISGAIAIVEATLPAFQVEMSQGSHFFHNLASHGVAYFSISGTGGRIDWNWLAGQEIVRETELVRHVRTKPPLYVKVDGRSGIGLCRMLNAEC